ncbi:Arm DNA-binding domain-containing protein [Novosphingobium sp. BW1]|uniref:Arm DNA-binding domain-containing protein n=1 Tax=Novosphingobium sp. BW1 TaxID=2592621 RepID=UPI00352C289F
MVQPSRAVVFRLDYPLNGRRGTLTLGRYGASGLSLAGGREKLIDARRAILEGRSLAQEKQRDKRRRRQGRASVGLANAGSRKPRWPTARRPCAVRSSSSETSCQRSATGSCQRIYAHFAQR